MRSLRTLLVGSLALLAIVAEALPAVAAPPSNDTLAGATPITALPFAATEDTTEATTDADDEDLAATDPSCDPRPALNLARTVWYTVNLASDAGLVVDFTDSSYDPGVIVATGGPGNWAVVACGLGATFTAVAGETYSPLVFDVFGTTGGQLSIGVFEVPPAPEVSLTVDRVGKFNARTGAATISGSVSCSGDVVFTELDVNLSQQVGRFTIQGFAFSDFACDGTLHAFTAEVIPSNGKFAGGRATVSAFAIACGSVVCGQDSVDQPITLRR